MGKSVFMKIHDNLQAHTPYFTQRQDATRRLGLSPKQKISSALRMLAYGEAADRSDEYLRIAESTTLECLSLFCRSVIEVFGSVYLRKPNANDVRRLFEMHNNIHGFPRMLGSLDCMHCEWKNCPTAWQGQYTRGDQGVPTIMLEARDYPEEEPIVPDDFDVLLGPPNSVQDRIEADLRIRNRVNHHMLRDDLVEHV
ncbi:hypothetical protein M5689_006704 [Euphorbia peplus]|nr:hypothetical protein M5689_006704 [Euphorbia peplus]